jgi:uridylate kinase
MNNEKPASAKSYGTAKQNIVISLGGSVVAPGEIDPARNSPPTGPSGAQSAGGVSNGVDTVFLKSFKKMITKYLDKYRFFIFVGGGKVCRNYQKALLEFGADVRDRDMIGIDISRLNARVLLQVFESVAYSEVITNPTKKLSTRKDVVVAGGWKPGFSTDYCAVVLAKNLGIKTIVNISNIDYVYDLPAGRQVKTPQDFKNYKPLKEVNWKEFRKLVGTKWAPGLSMPFDPRASREAELLKIKVAVINGNNLSSVENFLQNKLFVGTTIQ